MKSVEVRYDPRHRDGSYAWPPCIKHHLRPCTYGCEIQRPADKLVSAGERAYLEGLGLSVGPEVVLRVQRDRAGNIAWDEHGRWKPVLDDKNRLIYDTIANPHPCPACGSRTLGTETRHLGTVEECATCARRLGFVA